MTIRARLVISGCLAVVAVMSAMGQDAKPAEKSAKPAAQVYDEKADAKEQIAAALKKAARENKRVLIQWGGNWCPWCLKLHELMNSNQSIAKIASSEYEVVHVDAGRNNKNVDLAQSYGADLPKSGFPYLTVLDSQGKPVANQETGALEKKDASGESVGVAAGHDPDKVLAFLQQQKVAWPVADAVLKDGLARAKASERAAFIHFRAAWCGWCIRMEDWMSRPNIAAILDKAIVDIKIDTDRMTGGKELFEKYSGGKQGIPWFFFADAKGDAIITSVADGSGNIGYPAAAAEIAHFEAMLRKACKKLSDADVETLVKSLREEGQKLEAERMARQPKPAGR